MSEFAAAAARRVTPQREPALRRLAATEAPAAASAAAPTIASVFSGSELREYLGLCLGPNTGSIGPNRCPGLHFEAP